MLALGPEIRLQFNASIFLDSVRASLILETNSAIPPREQLYQMYVKYTRREHGWLYCDLMQSDPTKEPYASFHARLVPRNASLEVEDD